MFDSARIEAAIIKPCEPAKAFVDDDGMYVPSDVDMRFHKLLISRDLFVEAYNKWIKQARTGDSFIGCHGDDDVDCWCE